MPQTRRQGGAFFSAPVPGQQRDEPVNRPQQGKGEQVLIDAVAQHRPRDAQQSCRDATGLCHGKGLTGSGTCTRLGERKGDMTACARLEFGAR